MPDVGSSTPNRIEILNGQRYFGSIPLLGAASVVQPAGTLTSAVLDLRGMAYRFVLLIDVTQAAGGVVRPRFRYLDPETLAQITGVNAEVIFSPPTVNGTGALTRTRFVSSLFAIGTEEVPMFWVLEWVVTVQTATLTAARLWATAAGD